jgi:nucleoside-diphosphate-sugar epimerase
LELAERIQKIVPSSQIEQTEISFQDARNYRVSSNKANVELGFAPKWSIEEGISEIADAIMGRRIKDVANPRFNNSESLRMQWGTIK